MADGDPLTFHKLLEGEAIPVPNGVGFIRTATGMRIAVTTETGEQVDLEVPGAARYYEVVVVPGAQWIVNHNLGQTPAAVTILTLGGVEVEANIVHTSVNQFVVDLSPPMAGQVIVQ